MRIHSESIAGIATLGEWIATLRYEKTKIGIRP